MPADANETASPVDAPPPAATPRAPFLCVDAVGTRGPTVQVLISPKPAFVSAAEEADSSSSSQRDISISGLFSIPSIAPSQRRRTLKSLKSHYGWHSVQAQADFLWFSGGGEEMRGAKSPRSGIQSDRTGREGGPLKRQPGSSEDAHVCLGVMRGELA